MNTPTPIIDAMMPTPEMRAAMTEMAARHEAHGLIDRISRVIAREIATTYFAGLDASLDSSQL